jgi:hypothetical protein
MATLIIEKAATADAGGLRHELLETAPTIVGRNPATGLALGDPRSSREHARVRLKHGRWVLEDLGSRNGTAVLDGQGWKRLDSAWKLSSGDRFTIGSSVLRFEDGDRGELWVGKEVLGCRLDRLLGAEAGVLKFAAWQLALDRPVRVDWVHPALPLRFGPEVDAGAALRPVILEAASLAAHPRIGAPSSGDFPDAGGRGGVLFKLSEEIEVRPLESLLALDLEARLRSFLHVADAVLARARAAGLALPIGWSHVAWTRRGEPWIPALELSVAVARLQKAHVHLPSLIAYLPPEEISDEVLAGRPRDAFAGAVYNLGALGYHLLTGAPPMGPGEGEETLRNHLRLAPAPPEHFEPKAPAAACRLLEAMLQKDLRERPASAAAVIEPLRALVKGNAIESKPAPARPAAAAAAPAAGAASRPARGPSPAPRAAPSGAAARQGAGRRRRRTSMLILLLVWTLLWAGLFAAARFLTTLVLQRLAAP